MSDEKVQQICLGILELTSIEELQTVNNVLGGRWSAIKNMECAKAKLSVKVGDMVTFDSRKRGQTFTGKLVKKNRTKGVVLCEGIQWTVPFSMLRKEG